MRGDPLSLQIKCHTKTQKAPGDIFRLLFPSLEILFTPRYLINKIIMGSSVEPSLRSCALAGGNDATKPIGVATYRILKRLPKELKGQLPGPEEIAKLLEDGE